MWRMGNKAQQEGLKETLSYFASLLVVFYQNEMPSNLQALFQLS